MKNEYGWLEATLNFHAPFEELFFAMGEDAQDVVRRECHQLVQKFCNSQGEVETAYLCGLCKALTIMEVDCINLLLAMVKRFPTLPMMSDHNKRIVVETLLGIGASISFDGWQKIGADTPSCWPIAIAGMLERDMATTILLFPKFHEDAAFHTDLLIYLNRFFSNLSVSDQIKFVDDLELILPHCQPLLQALLNKELARFLNNLGK